MLETAVLVFRGGGRERSTKVSGGGVRGWLVALKMFTCSHFQASQAPNGTQFKDKVGTDFLQEL